MSVGDVLFRSFHHVLFSLFGEAHRDLCTYPFAREQLHIAAMQFDDACNDGKSQPDAAMLGAKRGTFKTIKYRVAYIFGDAASLVLDGKGDHRPLFYDAQRDLLARFCEANGILQQIIEHLNNTLPIGGDRIKVAFNINIEGQFGFLQLVPDAKAGGFENFADFNWRQGEFEIPGINGHEVENIADNGFQFGA